MMEINVSWAGKMAFEAVEGDKKVVMDAMPEKGGEGKGLSPKKLLLSSLAGCTSMDVIAILRKMRVTPDYFNVKVEATSNEEHPIYFTHIKLIYQFKGEKLSKEKLEKAVSLSQERYCGISYMLGKASDISYEVVLL